MTSRRSAWLSTALALGVLLTKSSLASGQALPPPDTLDLHVVARGGVDIARAELTISSDGGVIVSARTDTAGRGHVILSGSGVYSVRVRAFGFVPLQILLSTPPGLHAARKDIWLSPQPYQLPPLRAHAVSAPASITAGETRVSWDAQQSQTLPADPDNPLDVLRHEAGIAATADGLSVAGQAPDQNRTTLDGLGFDGEQIPSEAVRGIAARVSTYDISQGEFSGGVFSLGSIQGSDTWGGSLALRGAPLISAGAEGGGSAELGISGGGGGPVVPRHVFVYGAADFVRSRPNAQSAQALNAADAARIRLPIDSLAQLVRTLSSLGLPTLAVERPTREQAVGMLRIDFRPSVGQSLSLRVNGSRDALAGSMTSPFAIAIGHAPRSLVSSRGVATTYAIGNSRVASETAMGGSWRRSTVSSDLPVPTGEVDVTAADPSGSEQLTGFEFGGGSYPAVSQTQTAEFSQKVVAHLTSTRRLLFGGGGRFTRALAAAPIDPGTFSFSDIAAVAAGAPLSYERSLEAKVAKPFQVYRSVFAGIDERRGGVNWTYGVRADETQTGTRDTGDGQSSSGHATLLSPRAGLRYDESAWPHWRLDVGAGRFGGRLPLNVISAAISNGATSRRLVCVGDDTPSPDWRAYLAGPAGLPETCGTSSSPRAGIVGGLPNETQVSSRFRPADTWRASLSLSRDVGRLWGVSATALLVRSLAPPSIVDRNLRANPAFQLAAEGNRPVFVDPSTIDTSSGRAPLSASRGDSAIGIRRTLTNLGSASTLQSTVSLSGMLGPQTVFSLSYSRTRTSARTAGFPSAFTPNGSTAGDPRTIEATSLTFSPAHAVQGIIAQRLTPYARVSLGISLSSGLRYTPMVGGDLNGDGFENDRAFVYKPGLADDGPLASGMRQLLDHGPRKAVDCLTRQYDRIAGPATCATGWISVADAKADFFDARTTAARRLTWSVSVLNLGAAFDALLHARSSARYGWGAYPIPDSRLLFVRGFNPSAASYTYVVNQNFGRQLPGLNPASARLVVQGRWTIGQDPRAQPLLRRLTLETSGAADAVRKYLVATLPNIPAVVLQLAEKDSVALGLTLGQRLRLQQAGDALQPAIDVLVDSIAGLVARGPTADPATRSALGALTAHALETHAAALSATRAILTAEQWSKVPLWLLQSPGADELRAPPIQVSVPTEPL